MHFQLHRYKVAWICGYVFIFASIAYKTNKQIADNNKLTILNDSKC